MRRATWGTAPRGSVAVKCHGMPRAWELRPRGPFPKLAPVSEGPTSSVWRGYGLQAFAQAALRRRGGA
jgi:hypothetical protein